MRKVSETFLGVIILAICTVDMAAVHGQELKLVCIGDSITAGRYYN